MKDFEYTASELDMARVMKMQQDNLQNMSDKTQRDSDKLDEMTARLEKLLMKKKGMTLDDARQQTATSEIDTPEEMALVHVEDTVNWDELVRKSHERYSSKNITIDNLLNEKDIKYGMKEIEDIENSFSEYTGLTAKDMAFLATATTLQSARWFILQKMFTLTAKGASAAAKAVGGGAKAVTGATATKAISSVATKSAINTVTTITEVVGTTKTFGQLIKKVSSFNSSPESADSNGGNPSITPDNGTKWNGKRAWRDIIMECVPYELLSVGNAQDAYGIGIADYTSNILGMDETWGTIFGTMNILTDTVTFDNYNTYRVARKPHLHIVKKITMKQMFMDAIKAVNDDMMRLPVAVYTQMMHQQGKSLTEAEFLSTFSEQRISTLYTNQYDMFTKSKKMLLVGDQAMIASLINMTIGLYHTLQYNPKKDGSFEQYESRTRTILSMSNAMSAVGNSVFTVATQNWLALDAGGMIIAFNRLMNDSMFSTRLKEEMIKTKMDETFKMEDSSDIVPL